MLTARIGGYAENTLAAFIVLNAYLQFQFDHGDFYLLTATSRRSIAGRNAFLAMASKTLTSVCCCGRIKIHLSDRRKVWI